MKYQLPQFIETEVKLVGPFTLRQFLWIAGGSAILFMSFMILPFFWFIVVAIIVAPVSLALAFIKIQGMPLINYVAIMLSYALNPKKYLFDNEGPPKTQLPNEQITVIR